MKKLTFALVLGLAVVASAKQPMVNRPVAKIEVKSHDFASCTAACRRDWWFGSVGMQVCMNACVTSNTN